MSITEENANLHKPGTKSGVILSLLLFLVVLAVACLAYLKSQGIDLKTVRIGELFSVNTSLNKDKPDKVMFEIGFDVKSRPAFHVYRDLIIRCSNNTIKGINKKGEEVWSLNVSIEKPLLESNGHELLAADLEGKNIYVISGREIKWENKVDGNIINADISADGYVAVVQEQRGYRNIVRVFDPRGMEMFSRNIVHNYVISAKISPLSEQLVINSLDASGVEINPSIEFFDMMGSPFAAKIPQPNTIFPSVWYLDGDLLLAASDSMLVLYDSERNEKWRKEFDRVYSSGVLLGKYVVAAVETSGDKSSRRTASRGIVIYNSGGQLTGEFHLDEAVKNIRTYSDIIAVNTIREVYFINSRGKFVGKYTSKTDITDVYFFSKLEAAVVTRDRVVIVRTN
jgi:hypothetical protein